MAIETTHGASIDLGKGVTRYFVVIADISTESELLAASSTATWKRRIQRGSLDISAAGQVEIKATTATTGTVKPRWYKRIGGAANITLDASDDILSNAAEALNIEGSAAATCDGWIDVVEGPDPK